MKPATALFAAILLLGGCYGPPKDSYRLAETVEAYPAERFGNVVFSRISDDVVMHTSTLDLPGIGPVRSNGLLVIEGDTTVLVDTAWSDQQTDNILDYAQMVLGKPVRAAVVTHAHQDKMGGIGALNARSIPSWSHPLSNELAAEAELISTTHLLAFENGWAVGEGAQALAPLRIYYPGGGHTPDNITVGIEGSDIAFAGCLIKGEDADTLGNLMDADTASYAASARRFGTAFPDARLILVSHSPPQDRDAIMHTAKMADGLND